MATNEYDYNPADLIGNVTVPRLTLPTIRSAKRRSDADGVSTVPYYPGVNAKKLDIEYTDNALVVQTVSLTIAGVGYQDLIDDIKALDPSNLEAIDMGGFLGIRNTNSGSTHYVKILPQSVSADEAAGLLGLEVFPYPGSISYAGELASTPGHRSQQNPQGATLISKGDDLQADAFNRAFVSVIREIEKLRADLERETISYVDVFVTVQSHEVSTSIKGFYLNDSSIRLPIRDVDPTTDFGHMEGYFTLLDPTFKQEVYVGTSKVQGLRVHYATSGTVLSGSAFSTWGTPDGGSIYAGTIENKIKHASVAITEIKGSVLYCPGATFSTLIIQKNDPLLISGATNTSPYDHNGWFAVVEVLDEEHLRVRPFGTNEIIPGVGPQETPFAINPLGTGFGNVEIYFGSFVPASSMFVSVNSSGLTNGTYIARIACGRSQRDPQVRRPFQHNGDPSAAITAHVTDPTDAHDSTAITGFTSATAWFDSSTISGVTLKATIEDVLTDLAATTGNGGSGRVGSPLITASGFTVPKTLAAGSISSQLLSGLNQLQTHETDSKFHPANGVVSGFGLGVYSFPNQPINGGTLVTEYLGQVRVFTASGTSFPIGANQYCIYLDLTDSTLKTTTTLTAAFASDKFPLWYIYNQGFGVTWTSDFRIPLASSYSRNKGIVTVGPSGTYSDFPDLASANDWISFYRGAYGAGPTVIPKSWEIVVQGNVVENRVSGLFSFPATVRGASLDAQGTPTCSVTIPPGTFSHQVHGEFAASTIPDGLNGIVIKDLRFITPTTTTTTNNPTIKITSNTYEITHWTIDNCVFSGGTNAPFIWVNNPYNYVVVPKHIVIRNCWFKGANNRTTENPLILVEKSQDCVIENCRFEGSTADILTNGIRFEGVTDAGSAYGHVVKDCTFELGGRHIIITNNVDSVTIKNCTFRSSRATAINHLSTGEVFIEDCKFIGCMTNSSTAEGVIWSDTGNGRLDVRNCRFKNWATGYACRALANTSSGSRFVNCVFTATAVNQAIAGLSNALFEANDFDLSPGAVSGNGHDIGVVLSVGSNVRIVNNAFRNCGSTATSGSDNVIATNGGAIVSGNHFNNCRGTLVSFNGINNVANGNVMIDVGAAATDIGFFTGSAGTVINGNVVTHTASGQHFNIAGNVKAQVQGNALTNAPTVFAGGMTGNLVRKKVVASIGSINVTGGATVSIAFIQMPTNTHGVHLIENVIVPAKVVNHEAGIRVTYDDGTQSTSFNSSGGALAIRIDDENAVNNFNTTQYLDLTTDLTVVSVEIVVRNVGATATQSLGQYRYYGWVVG